MDCVLTAHFTCIIDSFIGRVRVRSLKRPSEERNEYLDYAVGTFELTPMIIDKWLILKLVIGDTYYLTRSCVQPIGIIVAPVSKASEHNNFSVN